MTAKVRCRRKAKHKRGGNSTKEGGEKKGRKIEGKEERSSEKTV